MKTTDRTLQLLRHLAEHVSYRTAGQRAEYIVNIGVDTLCFSHNFPVLPDRFHRRETDKCPVAEHVMKFHMPDVFVEASQGQVVFTPGSFVPGVYKYQLSFDRRRRRWTKLEEGNNENQISNN